MDVGIGIGRYYPIVGSFHTENSTEFEEENNGVSHLEQGVATPCYQKIVG